MTAQQAHKIMQKILKQKIKQQPLSIRNNVVPGIQTSKIR